MVSPVQIDSLFPHACCEAVHKTTRVPACGETHWRAKVGKNFS
jgi:hypothetical protein